MVSNSLFGQVYEYFGNYPIGEGYYEKIDIDKEIWSTGDAVKNIKGINCSNKQYKCLKIGDELFFVPNEINREKGGKESSLFGQYTIYRNSPLILPFGKEIEYTIIDITTTDNLTKTIYYNNELGIVAFKRQYNKEYNSMMWLVSKCGLLSSEKCKK